MKIKTTYIKRALPLESKKVPARMSMIIEPPRSTEKIPSPFQGAGVSPQGPVLPVSQVVIPR